MTYYIIKDKRNSTYKIKGNNFTKPSWTPNKDKAQLFKSITACKCSTRYIRTDRNKLDKGMLPDWIEIISIEINFK